MKLFKIILLLLVLSGVALFAFAYFMGYLDNEQEIICVSLKPGLSQQELISALGTPIGRPAADKDNLILSFRANIVAAGPIRAWVDPKTEKVVRLRCQFEGSSDTWKINQ